MVNIFKQNILPFQKTALYLQSHFGTALYLKS